MKRKQLIEWLKKTIQDKRNKVAALQQRSDASNDLAEVRSIGETLAALRDEINDAEKQLKDLEDGGDDDGDGEGSGDGAAAGDGDAQAAGAVVNGDTRAVNPLGSFKQGGDDQDMAYRTAFMNFVCRGTAIPAEFRANESTTSADAAVIPTTLVNQIVEKMDNVGMVLPLINKTSYRGGVAIPVSSVKPVASWVAEGATSDKQKKAVGNVTFAYYKLRCEVSFSLEIGALGISAFEAKFSDNVAKAMIYAIENAVINGTGTGQPTGILTAGAKEGATVAGTMTDALSFAALAKAEGLVPAEYETGEKWCMNKKTFARFLGLVDSQGQPIARVNYGLGAAPERTILGRDVIITPYTADNSVFLFDFSDYTLNTAYDMGIQKRQDWDTEDNQIKAVMNVDGKPVLTDSLITWTVPAEA